MLRKLIRSLDWESLDLLPKDIQLVIFLFHLYLCSPTAGSRHLHRYRRQGLHFRCHSGSPNSPCPTFDMVHVLPVVSTGVLKPGPSDHSAQYMWLDTLVSVKDSRHIYSRHIDRMGLSKLLEHLTKIDWKNNQPGRATSQTLLRLIEQIVDAMENEKLSFVIWVKHFTALVRSLW